MKSIIMYDYCLVCRRVYVYKYSRLFPYAMEVVAWSRRHGEYRL